MTKEQYERWSAPFRGREHLVQVGNKVLTYLCYLLYPLLVLGLALGRDPRFFRCLWVPGVCFVLLTLVRRGINAPRPYEVLDIDPIIQKDTKGKSMPSRHVFSIFVIAMAWLWVVPWAGAVLLALGVILAAVRVVGGVHFPRDVLAGAGIGVACGLVGFWLIGG